MLTTLRAVAHAPVRLPPAASRHLVIACVCTWAGAFAYWCRYSEQAALPLLPTVLLIALVAAAAAERTRVTRAMSRSGRSPARDASWPLLAAGAALIPPLTLGAEFFAYAFRPGIVAPVAAMLFGVLLGAGSLALGYEAWHAARTGDRPTLGRHIALLSLTGGVFWYMLLLLLRAAPSAL